MHLKFLLLLFLFISFLFLDKEAFAHGGVEKSSGPVTVDIFQDPLSPLVDEKVKFSFIFNDTELKKRIPNLPVKLKVINTFEGDESKDKVILETSKKTDKNGAFNL